MVKVESNTNKFQVQCFETFCSSSPDEKIKNLIQQGFEISLYASTVEPCGYSSESLCFMGE